ncbi:MAG: ABC transporter permease [Defluviitaleaceae bacterium]|nr:ABC transporter permease [Defluviitaleaceae bacterium]
MSKALKDSHIMFMRCLTKTLRSPEAVTMALVVPLVMMVLFGFVFGGIADIEGFNYINFIVPGIIIQCICNSSGATALSVHNDMSKGIIDRFRSMQIAKSAFLSGHVWLAIVRSMIICIMTFAAAFIVGFRPSAGFLDWLVIAGILVLFIIAITWVIVIFGLIASDGEAISGLTFLIMIFTFLSSGFAPPETLPRVLRVFAQNQPMTPVIDAVRGLMHGTQLNGEIMLAVAWCIGITVVAFIVAVQIYKNKLTK